MAGPRASLIAQEARRRGLDPQAVLSVAGVEGGVEHSAVGDHGTSFGPWQLHEGGALPAQYGHDAVAAQAFANSPAGIRYAEDQMVKAGAAGLHGRAAVATIVKSFERPADPTGEIARAMGLYGSDPAAGGGAGGTVGGSAPGGQGGMPGADIKGMTTQLLLSQASRLANGEAPDFSGLISIATLGGQLKQLGNTAAQATGGAPNRVSSVVAAAEKFLGTPYKWGGTKPGGFDCSGLLQYVMAEHGVHIPRTTYDQFQTGTKVNPAHLQPGDAVFFNGSDAKNGLPGHVGMYIGGGKFIEAPHTGAVVRISNLQGRTDFVGARRYG
jgi:cell wall-associated NlpC family hydrolase